MGITRPVLWLNDPLAADQQRRTGWPALYDITDDWTEAAGNGRTATLVETFERELFASCGAVVVCSEAVAEKLVLLANAGKRGCIVFGNEKSGLTSEELGRADLYLRIPMAAEQPSINLAQAVQIVSYQLLRAALDARSQAGTQTDRDEDP